MGLLGQYESETLLTGRVSRRTFWPVLVASVIVCQLSLLGGVSQGYSSILLSQLENPDSPLQITADQGSWIASLGTICRPIGALLEGYIVDKYGRKSTFQLVSLLISASWLLTYFSRSVTMLYISRIILSFALGMIICVGLYIVEICRPAERGTLLSLITPMTMAGTLLVYVLGYVFPWTTVAMILCVYCLAIFGLSFFIPETPIWYMQNWEKPKAMKSLMWLRGDTQMVEEEIAQAEARIQHMPSNHNYLQHFRDAAVWKPFVILSLFSVLQQQVGYNILTYYASDFFSSFEHSYDSDVLSIIFAALSTISSFLLMTVMHKFNRKTFLAASGLGMAASMAIGAISLSIKGVNENIPIFCVFLYVLFCMLGMIDIPWMIIGEFFPTKVRGSMSGNVTVIIFFIQFASLKTYPWLLEWIGVSGMFWYFSIFCFLSVAYVKIYFPETKDRSLFDIEQSFRQR